MDFLEIRRKAKERAAARAPAVVPPAPAPEPAPAAAPPEPAPAAPAGPDFGLPLFVLEAEGLKLTPLSGEAPPDLEPREAPKAEEPLPPAPRWPPVVDGGALVEALREELVVERRPPEPPGAAPAAPAWDPPPAPPAPAVDVAPHAPAARWTPVASEPAPAEPAAAPARAASAPDPLAEFFFDDGEEAPALEGLTATTAVAIAPDPEVRREYLTFLLGAEEYAVEIERVREVLKAPAVTEVPRAPAHVLGVIMVRGEVIAVFDPRHRLGLPPSAGDRSGRVLVCDAGEGPVGLLVDAVANVVRLRPSDVEPRPQGIGGAAAEYIAGIGRDRDRMVILLDLAAILRGAPALEAVA